MEGESEQERTRKAAERATVVFSGEVVNMESSGSAFSSAAPVRVELDVSRVWKGPAYETLTVETARSGASCGYDFDEGRRYLVYADKSSLPESGNSESLQVGLCDATRPIPETGASALLGESGTIPDTENPNPPGSQAGVLPETGGASLAAIGLASLGIGAVFLVRRWSS
jgi:LPXTG-motif cell wall-anchored protein